MPSISTEQRHYAVLFMYIYLEVSRVLINIHAHRMKSSWIVMGTVGRQQNGHRAGAVGGGHCLPQIVQLQLDL